MDLERPPPPPSPSPEAACGAACSVCLDPVVDRRGERSIAKLQCGHEFHLDCIGSAFNAKGVMQCPNCRKIEKGRWLYANGHRPSTDFDIGGWVTGESYDTVSELPFGFQWCPFSGFTQLASMFEEGETEPTSYHTVGDHSSAASSSLVCPYLALRGFLHPMHVPSSSASSNENTFFHRHPTGMEGHTTADSSNVQVFHATEPRNHDREHQYLSSLRVSGTPDHSAAAFGMGQPRYDDSNQQRPRTFVGLPHTLFNRPTPHSGSNLVAPLGSASVAIAETRGHGHGARGRVYQEPMPSSMPSNPFPPTTRRVRPTALTIASFIAASSSAELGGHHGFPPSGAVNRSLPNGDGVSRRVDRPHGRSREGFSSLPWIPAEDESRWWAPFNPTQNHAHGSFTRRPAAERASQSHPENGYQPLHPPRMPPFS